MHFQQSTLRYTARLVYRHLSLRMGDHIDENMLAKKTALYEKLTSAYVSQLDYPAPVWTALVCYRLEDINNEYASFLAQAPLPKGFSADEKKQYSLLIDEQVQTYRLEAKQYQKTGIELAQKIRSFDKKLLTERGMAQYPANEFGVKIRVEALAIEALADKNIRAQYDALYKDSTNPDLLLNLARRYMTKGDFMQAKVAAQSLLGFDGISEVQKTEALTLIGVSYLNAGNDEKARNIFEEVLALKRNHIAATINLAALMSHYGYHDYAESIYRKVSKSSVDDSDAVTVYPAALKAYRRR
jgi:Flp pilus assembly protein TadD